MLSDPPRPTAQLIVVIPPRDYAAVTEAVETWLSASDQLSALVSSAVVRAWLPPVAGLASRSGESAHGRALSRINH